MQEHQYPPVSLAEQRRAEMATEYRGEIVRSKYAPVMTKNIGKAKSSSAIYTEDELSAVEKAIDDGAQTTSEVAIMCGFMKTSTKTGDQTPHTGVARNMFYRLAARGRCKLAYQVHMFRRHLVWGLVAVPSWLDDPERTSTHLTEAEATKLWRQA